MTKLILKRTMTNTVRESIPDKGTAKKYLDSIAETFTESEKVETSVFLDSLITIKYSGSSGIRENILKMIEISTKLKDLKIVVDDQFIVHMALKSLPAKFNLLKTTYSAQKDKWSLNKLISMCVQKEERMKKEELIVNMVSKPQSKPRRFKEKKNLLLVQQSLLSSLPTETT